MRCLSAARAPAACARLWCGVVLPGRRERAYRGVTIPYERIYKAVKRFAGRKCRALLQGKYWVLVKYERRQNQLVFLTLMPKDYILPEPSIWVLI